MNNVGDSRPNISVIARDRRGANKKQILQSEQYFILLHVWQLFVQK